MSGLLEHIKDVINHRVPLRTKTLEELRHELDEAQRANTVLGTLFQRTITLLKLAQDDYSRALKEYSETSSDEAWQKILEASKRYKEINDDLPRSKGLARIARERYDLAVREIKRHA